MSRCDQEQFLSAYHDGELAADDRARVEQHLRDCPACTRELEQIRAASLLLREYPFQDLTPGELRDLHDAIEDAGDRQIWRIGGSVGLIAASILVIGLTWLNVLPDRPQPNAMPTPAGPIAAGPAQDWQRIAMTLRPDPLRTDDTMGPTYARGDIGPVAAGVPRYDTGLADYMVEGLGQRAVP